MGKDKKCYNCMMEVDGHAKVCPKCESKLGRRLSSGIAEKPGFPFFKALFVLLALGAAARLAGYSDLLNAAAETPPSAALEAGKEPAGARDAAIRKIKEKGAENLGAVGVNDVGYQGDTLLVYVDQRFIALSKAQQEQLLVIVAGEWQEAIGKDSVPVRVLEQGTGKTIAELVV